MFEFIYVILGSVMRFIYDLVQNFGWAIILFTVLVRVCMLPLVIKQQKSMAHMAKIQPALQELQKKYQYDKEKLNEETVKLYQQHKINPMSSCLPLLIQMPILFAVYGIIQNPATYILLPGQQGISAAMAALAGENLARMTQLDVVAWVSNNMAEAATRLADVAAQFNLTAESFFMNFNFLGVNLGHVPGNVVMTQPLYWLFPVLAALSTFLTSFISQKMNAKTQTAEQASQMKTMQYVFPLMTGYFCYILPAAMGLYWIVGNILQVIQSFTLDRYVVHKESNEIEVKAEQKRLEKKELKKKKKK